MRFEDILGDPSIKSYLKESIAKDRVAHAQLFVGEQGVGVLPMAIAYATELICFGKPEDSWLRCKHLTHPDMHFAFPVNTNSKVKKDPVSSMFMQEWKSFLQEQPYGSLYDWYKHIEIDGKQGNISVREAREIASALSLKSYEGGYKVMLIWNAEKMNIEASNHLLKLLEEPPAKTVFLLVVENENQLLDTIRSRCQIIRFSKLGSQAIQEYLMGRGISEQQARRVASRSNGNIHQALALIDASSDEKQFEKWFVFWVRSAFRAKGNKTVIQDLIQWSEELSQQGREVQKQFLLYCLEVFRQALLMNYNTSQIVDLQMEETRFDISKFAPFVHENNIFNIREVIEEALLYVERNVNSKMVFMNLSILLTRFLHIPRV